MLPFKTFLSIAPLLHSLVLISVWLKEIAAIRTVGKDQSCTQRLYVYACMLWIKHNVLKLQLLIKYVFVPDLKLSSQ